MAFCWENFLSHFQLLEDDDGANCEQSDTLLTELEKQVNICDLVVSFLYFLLHRLEGSCMKGLWMQNCSRVYGTC